jgi:hypothetical protein
MASTAYTGDGFHTGTRRFSLDRIATPIRTQLKPSFRAKTNFVSVWGDIPTWFTAIGTCGAVVVSLWLARRDALRREQQERRQQAELVTAWLGEEVEAGDELHQAVVIQNSSSQSVYFLIASLVAVQGAFRRTAVPSSRSERGLGRLKCRFV